MARMVLIKAHPAASSFGRALADAYAQGAIEAGAKVQTLDLRALRFDPILRSGFSGAQPLEPDLLEARRVIEWADHLVVQFPVWWGASPALLKGFIDRVFLPGWAFRNVPGRSRPEGLLEGRTARVLCTMDSPWWWYWLKHGRAAHRSLIGATLNYVGVHRVQQTTVYALRTLDADARAAWMDRARSHGRLDARARSRQDG